MFGPHNNLKDKGSLVDLANGFRHNDLGAAWNERNVAFAQRRSHLHQAGLVLTHLLFQPRRRPCFQQTLELDEFGVGLLQARLVRRQEVAQRQAAQLKVAFAPGRDHTAQLPHQAALGTGKPQIFTKQREPKNEVFR